MEYYSAVKRNEIGSFVETWMDLESVIQSAVSQKEKSKILYINTHMWNLERWYRWIYFQGRNRDSGVGNGLADTGVGRKGACNINVGNILKKIKYQLSKHTHTHTQTHTHTHTHTHTSPVWIVLRAAYLPTTCYVGKSMSFSIMLIGFNPWLCLLDHKVISSNLNFIFSIYKIETVLPGLIWRVNETRRLVPNTNLPSFSVSALSPLFSMHNK